MNDGKEELLIKDGVRRKYLPVRDKYIEIVQHCRNISFDVLETHGWADFKRTATSLAKIGHHLSQENIKISSL